MFETSQYDAMFEQIEAIRAHRAVFLTEVASGSLSLEEVFDRSAIDRVISTMKILPAVETLPEFGKVQTRRAFEEVGIEEDALVGHVEVSQVAGLPAALARHAR
jgi:hypothetical protein